MKTLIITAMGLCLLLSMQSYHVIQPVQIVQKQSENPVQRLLKELGCPKEKLEKITKAVELASNETNLSPFLIGILLFTESGFDPFARSPKNYHGLMQTPTATNKFMDVDVLHGARILQEKLKISKGDLFLALSLYKGGNNSMARKQAGQCLNLYRKVMAKG